MLSLPELRLGDRIIRLPLSPPGTVDVANAWLTADAGERHFLWLALLRRESGLALWGALRLPPDSTRSMEGESDWAPELWDLIARTCDQDLLRAYVLPPAHVTPNHRDWERRANEASEAFARACNDAQAEESPVEKPSPTCVSLAALAHALRALETAKLAALREFAYGLSHEINNPLANIATRAQTLLRDEKEAERRRSLSVIAQQAMRGHTMIADVMLFAKPPALRRAPIQPRQIIDRLVSELREWADQQHTRLVVCTPGAANSNSQPQAIAHEPDSHEFASWDDWIEADGAQLLVALRAIATNALEALHTGGQIEFSVDRVRSTKSADSADNRVHFVVRDNGPGIAPAVRSHLFDPYYSGREAGRGLGVGLCKAWRIATDHGGTVEVFDAPGGGAEFHLVIPAIPVVGRSHS
ncbi:MAG: HAMP domain-containing sensor histidine kinase [Pirellulales bacterium]